MGNKYMCVRCTQTCGILNFLRTGCLTGHGQQDAIRYHISGNNLKPINGIYLETGLETYQSRGHEIGSSGILEIEPSGGINAYLLFDHDIGTLQISGVTSGRTRSGKAVLVTYPSHVKWFPATG